MNNFIFSSIGKKLIMSITGIFLIFFLLVHLCLNLLLLIGNGEVFEEAAHFMATNPAMKIMEYALAIGFILHIIYSGYLTLLNYLARPVKYKMINRGETSSWSSRNMGITGVMVLIFLVIHLINYLYKIKFTDLIESGQITKYELVIGLYKPEYWYFVVIYIVSFILLGLHLNHSLQSSFQTLGWNNKIWGPRLKNISSIYALIIAVGFSIIPLYFLIT
ncbi:MAG: succinate dehydrogenase cytochrome b subunit [Bacteroidota bacterium]